MLEPLQHDVILRGHESVGLQLARGARGDEEFRVEHFDVTGAGSVVGEEKGRGAPHGRFYLVDPADGQVRFEIVPQAVAHDEGLWLAGCWRGGG